MTETTIETYCAGLYPVWTPTLFTWKGGETLNKLLGSINKDVAHRELQCGIIDIKVMNTVAKYIKS